MLVDCGWMLREQCSDVGWDRDGGGWGDAEVVEKNL